MQDYSSMTAKVYTAVYYAICIGVCLGFWCFLYDSTLLKIGWVSVTAHVLITSLGYLFTLRRNRTLKAALAVNTIVPGVYTFLAYHSILSDIVAGVCLVFLLFIFVRTFLRRFPPYREKSVIIIGRLKRFLSKSIIIVGMGTAYLAFILAASNILYQKPFTKAEPAEAPTPITFTLDDWEKADESKKIEYSQSIVDYECKKMGLKKLTVTSSTKLAKTRQAYYNDDYSIIVVNSSHLKKDNLLSVLNSLAHECYHALEFSLIKNSSKYIGDTKIEKNVKAIVKLYKNEFKDYKSYESSSDEFDYESFYEYYTQICESDARKFGDTESIVLYKLVITKK